MEFVASGKNSPQFARERFIAYDYFLSPSRIVFVDGGHGELVTSASYVDAFIRVAAVSFSKNRRVALKKEEGIIRVSTDIEGSQQVFRISGEHFSLPESVNLEAVTLADTASRLQAAASHARRIAEIGFAEELTAELAEGDVIVLDGTLEPKTRQERSALEKLYAAAIKSNVLVTALAKTSTMVTNLGNDALSVLLAVGPKGPWYYEPLFVPKSDGHNAAIFAVRLHESSKHAFRFEICSKQKAVDWTRLFGALSMNSRDFTFPGYPYGLILADRIARVSEHDREFLRARHAGKLGINLDTEEASANAHQILDSL